MDLAPLAERMRPKNLDEIAGQEHLIGKGKILRNIYESGNLPSMIFWGPPGVGKTTLAEVLAANSPHPFVQLSAIAAGVKDVRNAIDLAKKAGKMILFIDEIHRFNKAQQDALLGAVEKGWIVLIGATTENPSFEVISALLSRCQVYVLEPLTEDELESILKRAVSNDQVLKENNTSLESANALIHWSGGDGRRLLNLLDLVSSQANDGKITDELVDLVVKTNPTLYDKSGEMHYDLISAFIKSIRGSDPNAAVYYLARMVAGGEDPKFIARRMVILASEDIGNANPTAMVLANSCFEAVNKIGYPESRIILSQTAIYLAGSPKSNSSYMAIESALAAVKKDGDLSVPLSLRNAPTSLMKSLDYGKDYGYSHQGEGNFIDQEFLPDKISGTRFYEPGNNPREDDTRKRLRTLWQEKYGY